MYFKKNCLVSLGHFFGIFPPSFCLCFCFCFFVHVQSGFGPQNLENKQTKISKKKNAFFYENSHLIVLILQLKILKCSSLI
jgi:hypothetical protein